MTVVSTDEPGHWTARRNGQVSGTLRAQVRPDGRCYLSVRDCATESYEPLLDSAIQALDQDLYVELAENDVAARKVFLSRGFVLDRQEHHFLLITDPAHLGTAETEMPDGFGVVSAADADLVRLCSLDARLRSEVPGVGQWQQDPDEFAEETFDESFDPETYLIATEHGSGQYVGLVRVWINPDRPRLGMIGTLKPYRRRRLALSLLTRVLGVLHERGHRGVMCEVDTSNDPSKALMLGLGARRVGGADMLVRRCPP